MKKIWLFIFVAFCSAVSSFGQTRIRIEDKGYANIPLRIYAYENLLSHSPRLLANDKVDAKGELCFSLPIKEAQLLYIPLYSFRLIFYAEPNKELLLKLPSLGKLQKAFSQLKSYSGREIPLFTENKMALNQAISKYDNAYNDFLKKHFQAIYLKKNAKNYSIPLQKLRKLHSCSYFKAYSNYKETYLNYVAGEDKQQLLECFAHKPLLLHNTAYVSLLRKLAKPLATDLAQAPKYRRLYNKLEAARNYSSLQAIYKGLAATDDDAFNEHFFIHIMHSGVKQKTISPKVVTQKLAFITQKSPHSTNRQLAQSIIKKLTKQFAGSAAPAFSLQATNGKTYTESLLKKGKPTIVACFDSAVNNTESLNTLQMLQEKNKKAFRVVVWSAEQQLKNIPKDWLQFVVPYYSYALADYHLGRFPYYVLVDANGQIAKETWQQYLLRLGN